MLTFSEQNNSDGNSNNSKQCRIARQSQVQKSTRKTYKLHLLSFLLLLLLLPLLLLILLNMLFINVIPMVDALAENDECTLITNREQIAGICTVVSKCIHILDAFIKQGRLKESDVSRCALGPIEEIICCPNANIRSETERTTSKTPTVHKTPVDTRARVSAASIACEDIERELQPELSPHIYGGTPVERYEYPHMAAIAYETIGDGYEFRCGGSLISYGFILTAAHCVISAELQVKFVRLGAINLAKGLDKDSIDVNVAQIHIHPNYMGSKKYHDIAILELVNNVSYPKSVRPTCLYTHLQDPPKNLELYVSGWGEINESRQTSAILLKARLEIVPLTSCNESYATDPYAFNRNLDEGLQETQLCASDSTHKKDACRGDSGGPLIVVNDANKKSYHIVGITSTGFGCASSIPGLYTRVAAYLDYIEAIVWPDIRNRLKISS